jgi:hypothetical protein
MAAALAEALCRPRQLGQRIAVLAVIALGLGALACFLMFRMWVRNETVGHGITIAGLYMVSDASNFFECANWLLDYGKVGNTWCERRPLYPAILAGLSGLTGRAWLATLLAQAVLVSLCVLALARGVTQQAGLVAGVLVLGMMFGYAYLHAFPGTMTENAGVMLGALGTAFLLAGSRSFSSRTLFLGTALLSVALFARPGPMLMLPGLVAWALLLHWRGQLSGWRVIVAILAGIGVGPLLQAAVTLIGEGSLSNAQGNFSYTLYGLATGGRPWSAVFEDHPHVAALARVDETAAAREIYRLALDAIVQHPHKLLRGFARDLLRYLSAPMFDFPGGLFWGLPTLCWWIGGAFLLYRRANPTYALLAWLSVCVIFSAPVIGRDGGPRVYAAGFSVIALQAALGASALFLLLAKALQRPASAVPVEARPGAFEYGLVGVLALLLLIPLTPVRWMLAQAEAPAKSCNAGLRSIIVRLGYETHFLSIVPGARPLDALRMRVAPERLERRLIPGSWINEGIAALPKPITIVRAWPMDEPGEARFFWPGDLSSHNFGTIHACLVDKQSLSVAQLRYARAVSVSVIP